MKGFSSPEKNVFKIIVGCLFLFLKNIRCSLTSPTVGVGQQTVLVSTDRDIRDSEDSEEGESDEIRSRKPDSRQSWTVVGGNPSARHTWFTGAEMIFCGEKNDQKEVLV